MSEIPDDIMQAAREAYASMYPDYPCQNEISIIARAILAERERCAKRLEDTEEMLRELRACFAVQPRWRDRDLAEGWARVEELRRVDAFLAIRGGSHE